jgi:hypothetical protein
MKEYGLETVYARDYGVLNNSKMKTDSSAISRHNRQP